MKGRLPNKASLEHIVDALETVDLFIRDMTFDEFAGDLKTTFAVVKALEIVGEAANHITIEVRNLDGTINSSAIIALRHILVHDMVFDLKSSGISVQSIRLN